MRLEVHAGVVLAGYRVASLVGEGAMGAVYLAEEVSTGRRVALKLLAPELARDERFRERFLRETEFAASLEHPHIVRTLESGEDAGTLYLAMPYIEGSDLRELLRAEGRLEPERAVALVEQIAQALDAAHRGGLVHRDVKPGNILVAGEPPAEHAYVCDFGVSRHVSSVSSLTGDRGFVGTIDYVPPEQIQGGTMDGRADVYSLGCLLFECLSGARPFDRDSELAVVFAHLNEPAPRLSDLRPELPEVFDGVFATALAKAPDDRYSTCGELAAASRAALDGKTLPRRAGRRRSLLAGAAVAAAAAVTVGLVATRDTHTPAPSASTEITQTSISGVALGRPRDAYKRRFGGYQQLVLTEVDPAIPGLSFGQPEVAVYFRADREHADIITTWNRRLRTAAGVGPCSTIDELKQAYGEDVRPSPHALSPDGKTVYAYVVGRNLLFATQDQRTISAVALYRGSRNNQLNRPGSPQSWANFVAAVERPCK